jgi:hypothetical protein
MLVRKIRFSFSPPPVLLLCSYHIAREKHHVHAIALPSITAVAIAVAVAVAVAITASIVILILIGIICCKSFLRRSFLGFGDGTCFQPRLVHVAGTGLVHGDGRRRRHHKQLEEATAVVQSARHRGCRRR